MQRVHINPIAGNFSIFVWLFTFMGFYLLKDFNYRHFYSYLVQKYVQKFIRNLFGNIKVIEDIFELDFLH